MKEGREFISIPSSTDVVSSNLFSSDEDKE